MSSRETVVTLKPKGETRSNSAVTKMNSSNSILRRIYSFSRILHENFGFVFVFKKEQRKCQKGLSYFPIEMIFDSEFNKVYDENHIKILNKVEKTKYCKQKVLNYMLEELKKFCYEFQTSPTNCSKKSHGEYNAITTQKIKSFKINSSNPEIFYNMDDVENLIGINTYEGLKESFSSSNVKNCVLCRQHQCNYLSSLVPLNSLYIFCADDSGFVESKFFVDGSLPNNLNVIPPSCYSQIPTESIIGESFIGSYTEFNNQNVINTVYPPDGNTLYSTNEVDYSNYMNNMVDYPCNDNMNSCSIINGNTTISNDVLMVESKQQPNEVCMYPIYIHNATELIDDSNDLSKEDTFELKHNFNFF